jgi:radical SAM superfamily enzyme YgiQ (UPF0313 family)
MTWYEFGENTMTKKVFLIYPPAVIMNREDRCQQPVKELVIIPPLPPSDLMYMAAVAEKAGCECKIKDYSIKAENIEDFKNDIKEFDPDYLVINVTTSTLTADMAVCRAAKEVKPEIVTIAKGAHFLTFNAQVLDEFPALDLIIRGEPEITLQEIVEGKNWNEISGLTYKKDGLPFNNSDRYFLDDLDLLPYPARHLIDNALYIRPDNGKVQAVIKVSRGCPFHCFFCLATPVSGKKVRVRSPKNIVGELKECIEKYDITNFLFWSDIFNMDRQWVIDLCNEIINSGLKIIWASNTRADTADLEMAKLMYQAGCRLVSIGVESGSQEMLNKMGKKTNLEQIRNTNKILKQSKIKIYNYFVLGLPWETEETAEETIKFAIELDSDFVNFHTATAFPGSRFYDYVLENNLFETKDKEELYKSAYCYPTVKTHTLSKDRVFEIHKQALKRFYLRPSYILRMLSGITSFYQLKNYTAAGLSILFKR